MRRPDQSRSSGVPTTEFPKPFHRGRAVVARPTGGSSGPSPTLADPRVPTPAAQPRPPLSYQLRQLRRGGAWTMLGGLTAFVCWGIWALSARGNLAGPFLAFVLVLLVAVGLFAMCRLLGRMVLERGLGRVRRSAWPSHLVVGVFLVAAGLFYLRQIEWVAEAWTWLRALGS